MKVKTARIKNLNLVSGILLLTIILFFGGYVFYIYYSHNSVTKTETINNKDEEKESKQIELANILKDIPVYDNTTTVDENLYGQNKEGNFIGYRSYKINYSINNDIKDISEFYNSWFSQNSWEIENNIEDNCANVDEELCRHWQKIVARNNDYQVIFYVTANTFYEVQLITNRSYKVSNLSTTNEFKSKLDNENITVEILLDGINSEGSTIEMMYLSNIDKNKENRIISELLQAGWNNSCGCASSPGFSNCSCAMGNITYEFKNWDKDYFGEVINILKLSTKN